MEKVTGRISGGDDFCVPRLKPGRRAAVRNRNFSPMTLLDRFRDAVLRLIMISAISKSTSCRAQPSTSTATVRRPTYYDRADPYHSEAVADCIEFIKKKKVIAVAEESSRGSSTSAVSSMRRNSGSLVS